MVVLNPAPARSLPKGFFDCIDVIVPNESEASLLTGMPAGTPGQVEAAGRTLLEAGVQSALIVEVKRVAHNLPAYGVEVVDTTAAGNAFVAGLTVGLAEGMNLLEAVRLGHAAGAIAVTCLGA